jgi:AraC-like DNA-binding protein
VARLARFDRLTQLLRRGDASWAGLAAMLGFSDQAHLTREVRHFSGLTPTALSELLTGPIHADPDR